MLMTKQMLIKMLQRSGPDNDAPIMLRLKGEEREFPLDVERFGNQDGAIHLELEQTAEQVTDLIVN